MDEPLPVAPELVAWSLRVGEYLQAVDRPHEFSRWEERGVAGLRLGVQTPEPALRLVYWIRPEGEPPGFWLAIDHEQAERPTRFALRTARLFPGDERVLRRIEHLVIAQSVVIGRDE